MTKTKGPAVPSSGAHPFDDSRAADASTSRVTAPTPRDQSPQCRRCGRPLRAPRSVGRLLGPRCRGHARSLVADVVERYPDLVRRYLDGRTRP